MSQIQNPSAEPLFEVLWPLGRFVSSPVAPVPPLVDLNGKTVGELWDWVFRGDQIYPILNEELRKRFPDIRFVDYTVLGNTHGTHEREYLANLPEVLRQHGCDAIISGVGA